MKFVMDADCLIKLIEARMKEAVCHAFTVVLPSLVKRESDADEVPSAS